MQVLEATASFGGPGGCPGQFPFQLPQQGIGLCRVPGCDVRRLIGIGLLIVKFEEDRLRIQVSIIHPGNEAMAFGSERIPHEMILKEVAIPGFPLLPDDLAFDLLDQGTEEGLSHAG